MHDYPPDDRQEWRAWYFYDWANSAFATTVAVVFLGPYLTEVTKSAADAEGFVYPLGIAVRDGSFYPYIVSLSVLLQVTCLPVLGALADYSNRKKLLLAVFSYLGAAATIAMYFVEGARYQLGGGLFLLANLSFGAGMVFYNAFLPEIATEEHRDEVSSRGWAMGYLGGGLLLALNLGLFAYADTFGLSIGHVVRINLASAGVWWAVFALIPLSRLRRRGQVRPLPPGRSYLGVGFTQLRHTLREIRRYPRTLGFLIAYLCYNDGVQSVIALAAQFGNQELGIDQGTLTAVILMVQFVALGGSLAFQQVARRVTTKGALLISLFIWTGAVIWVGAFLRSTAGFVAAAAVIAVVLGGSQALSRSLYSLMIPRGKEAEYFSLYEISERGTSWLGPLLFGLSLQFTGSYRIAIASLILFFVVGIWLLARVDVRRAALEAGNKPPDHA